HRDHFAAASAEAEPVHRAGGQMDERTRHAGLRLPADAEIDLAFDDEERFVPGMAVRRRTTALGPTLQEDLVAFGGFAPCEHGGVLADDVESGRVVLRFDDERFHSHPEFPPYVMSREPFYLTP